jgi:hypothetical protein
MKSRYSALPRKLDVSKLHMPAFMHETFNRVGRCQGGTARSSPAMNAQGLGDQAQLFCGKSN